jgi:CHAT domain-containing protein
VFAQTPASASSDDIILYAGETYNLTLNADLLVLSSCESGTGKIVKGEGMMGMTRGFFYAGARNIMYSLWKVFDKHTNKLMQEFYEHVLDGETFSSAMREAKLSMIRNPTTAFPGKWAGFILMGK